MFDLLIFKMFVIILLRLKKGDIMKTIPIVDQIKNQEEEKYNLIIETETPTVIEYFKNNLQGKNLNLSDSLSMLIIGLNAIGVADCENRKICIFKKSQGIYKNFKNFN